MCAHSKVRSWMLLVVGSILMPISVCFVWNVWSRCDAYFILTVLHPVLNRKSFAICKPSFRLGLWVEQQLNKTNCLVTSGWLSYRSWSRAVLGFFWIYFVVLVNINILEWGWQQTFYWYALLVCFDAIFHLQFYSLACGALFKRV